MDAGEHTSGCPSGAETSGADPTLKEVLDLIAAHLSSRRAIPDILPGTPQEQAILRTILETLKTTQTHLLEISEGKLDSPITLKGPFGGGLKNLQSHLKHLTWKTQAIAKGDFTQKVDFLHDFSVAFNSMVSELDEAKKSLIAQTEEIRATTLSLFTSREQYKSLIHESPIAICIEQAGTIVLANPAFLQMFRIPHVVIPPGWSVHRFISSAHIGQFREKISFRSESGGEWNRFEEDVMTTDGLHRIAEFTVSDIIFDGQPATLYYIQDITGRKEQENQVLSSLEEKEILLKEVYHRVKNNMQVIWSLLAMQSRMVEDETVRGYFVECQNRVKSLSLVHEHLYKTESLREIRYSTYLRQISAHLFQTYRVRGEAVTLFIDAGDETIPLSKAVPCSLIVNELLSNSLKYAFDPPGVGTIEIRFRSVSSENQYILEYRDSGPGIPPDMNPARSRTLGMQLIYGLTRQLKGTVSLENDPGAHYIISFPMDSSGDT